MKFLILFGPNKIGKTAIGKELASITELSLFNYHTLLEFLIEAIGYFDEEAIKNISKYVLEILAKDQYRTGLILAYRWNFSKKNCNEIIKELQDTFVKNCNDDVECYYVELYNDAFTLTNKEQNVKREMIESAQVLSGLSVDNETLADHFTEDNYMCINIHSKEAKEIAEEIKTHFNL